MRALTMMLHRNRQRMFLFVSALFLMFVLASQAVHAATFVIVNYDAAGVGFNDPTPVAPVGGNSGATLGAQRLIAFQFAANIWGGLLSSPVPIRVGATFSALDCGTYNDGTSWAILGSAGPNNVARDFSGAPIAGTYYPIALANALHGSDLDPSVDPSGDDIGAEFNGNIGTPGCLDSQGWYLGLDGNNPPGVTLDFVSVLVHELGHGLGFLTFVDLTSGAKLGSFPGFEGRNDTFMLHLEDHVAAPSDYPSMTNAQRVAASTDTENLHWVGANVRAASGVLSAGAVGGHVQMFAPFPQEGGSSVSHWDTALTPDQIMEPIYTSALHNPVLELPLFKDIGWALVSAATAPGAPTITGITGGNGTASVTFTEGSDGGSAITGNTVTCAAGGQTTRTNTGLGSPITVSALTGGVNYSCSVTASNSVGTSASSGALSVTPVTPPDAPIINSITIGHGSATINFTAPANGGSAITGYSATCAAAGQTTRTNTGAGSPIIVRYLTGGIAYSCSVTASNSVGTSSASAPLPVTPLAINMVPIWMLLLD